MKTLSVSMVKNEGDFIESFIRLNARNVDRFLIVDDSSSDDTLPILAELIKEGFVIQLFSVRDTQLGLEQQQGNILSSILQTALSPASGIEFDFAYLLDADEILLADRAHHAAQLSRLGPLQVGQLPWITHVPTADGFESSANPVQQLFRPKLREEYQYYKAVIPRAAAVGASIVPGNHGIVRAAGAGQAGDLASEPLVLDLPLGHFPIRNSEQLITKALIGSHKLSIKPNRLGGEGYHWDWMAQRLRANGFRIDFAELQRIAAYYPLVDRADQAMPALGEAYALPDITLRFPRPRTSALARLDAFLLELCRDYQTQRGKPADKR